MKKTYVVYHDNCTDGFGACYAAYLKFKDQATYLPLNHYDPIPEFEAGSIIYLVDFCFEKDVLISLSNTCEITVLDHHLSSYQQVQSLINNPIKNLNLIFDLSKSGCVLAWNYWHNSPLPSLFSYIQDRDLGEYKLPFVKEVISALMTYEKTFSVWKNLKVPELIKEGKTILRVQEQIINEMISKAHFVEIDNQIVPAVNATAFWSDATIALAKKFPNYPFVAAYYALDSERIKWSLRSVDPNLKISSLAEKYGGGGHGSNGGFTASKNQIEFIPSIRLLKTA